MRKNLVTRNKLYIQTYIGETSRALKSSEEENVQKHTWTGRRRGGAGTKLLAHTISFSLMEKNINI